MAETALVNGRPDSHALISNRGLAYGDGLFETIAYSDGALRLWDLHVDRLLGGCQRLGIPLPDIDLLEQEALQSAGRRRRSVVKIILTRVSAGRGYTPVPMSNPDDSPYLSNNSGVDRIVQAFDWPTTYDKWQATGVHVGLCESIVSENPQLAGIKHLNRLDQVLGAKEVFEKGWDEGLMARHDGPLVGGTKSNFYMLHNGVIYTPQLRTCGVAGVMREHILRLAPQLNFVVEQRDIEVEELLYADAIFISNAILGIAFVSSLSPSIRGPSTNLKFERNNIVTKLAESVKH